MHKIFVLWLGIGIISGAYAQAVLDLPFSQAVGVIADNDDHRDVYTDEFLIALSHLEKYPLLGIITTYTPNMEEYELFVEGRKEIVEKARQSGLKHLPQVFSGTSERLVQPESHQIWDTKPRAIDASSFIVQQAQQATPEQPLVIVAGGQLTSIANAYLLDTTIAEKVIISGVFGVREMDYNAGLDGWAWKIILSRFRVFAVPIGPSDNRGMVYMKPPLVDKQQIKERLPQDLPLFKWMYEKSHPSNPLPDGADYDGQAAIPLIRPDYITQVKRWRVTHIDSQGELRLIEDPNGPIYEALDADQEIATKAFWNTMEATVHSLE